MKRIAYISVIVCMLLACGPRKEYKEALLKAEELMDDHPDSALQILDSLGLHEAEFNRHFRMQYLLHRMNAENKTSDKFTSDSLCNVLVKHFDRHGTVNERVLAHYLLGRAYTDMGEAPLAINSYQDAISATDTTATDFKFSTLNRVYAQMADIYHYQLLLTNEIEARNQASYYAFRANQPKWGIYNQAMIAGAYILLNQKDSAEFILKSAIEQYRKYGYDQWALRSSKMLMYLYTNPPQRLVEAKALMDQFEAESELFDEHHELPPSQRQYYEYKGKYYEGIGKLDSAEYYYRKIYRPGMTPVDQDPMYSGLLRVFTKRHQADSIAKYARLYCMANDSSIALKDRDVVAQMSALYNYNRLEKEAAQERERTHSAIILLVVILLISVLLLAAIALTTWLYRRNQKAKQERIARLEESLNNAKMQRMAIQEELRQLKENNYEVVISLKEQQEAELTQTIERLQTENDAYKRGIPDNKSDRIEDFLESGVAQVFVKKADGKSERPKPTDAEWNLLTSQFSKDVPATFKSFGEGKPLSQLEQRICILLILDIPEKAISAMTDSHASTVSNAKARANEKLFGKKDAYSLKNNLIRALK
ncbi:MAG: hypothetical protein IKX65_06545 [Prevotella sp.]|nr:hypothetical protein [Prevotella sp.]